MAPPEIGGSTTVRHEHPNTEEAETKQKKKNNLKNNCDSDRDPKKEMRNSLK